MRLYGKSLNTYFKTYINILAFEKHEISRTNAI